MLRNVHQKRLNPEPQNPERKNQQMHSSPLPDLSSPLIRCVPLHSLSPLFQASRWLPLTPREGSSVVYNCTVGRQRALSLFTAHRRPRPLRYTSTQYLHSCDSSFLLSSWTKSYCPCRLYGRLPWHLKISMAHRSSPTPKASQLSFKTFHSLSTPPFSALVDTISAAAPLFNHLQRPPNPSSQHPFLS
jgi:hypothetical protein